jgi:hypothetical protein
VFSCQSEELVQRHTKQPVRAFQRNTSPRNEPPCVIRSSSPPYDTGGGCSPCCPARVQQKVTGLIVFIESGASCETPIVPSALVSSHWRVGDLCARKSKHASATWRNCPVTIADLRGICMLRGLDSVPLARPQSSCTSSNAFLAREGHFSHYTYPSVRYDPSPTSRVARSYLQSRRFARARSLLHSITNTAHILLRFALPSAKSPKIKTRPEF